MAFGPSQIMEEGSRAHLLDIEAVGLGQSDRNFLDPQDVLKQALGKPPDVAPDLFDCGLRDGHLGLAQLT